MNRYLDVDAPRLLTVEQAVELTGKSAPTIYRWKTRGLIKQYGERGRLMFLDTELDQAKNACEERKARNLRRPT